MEKIFYHIDRIWLYQQKKIVYPITIELHITNVCNQDCYYCYSRGKFDGHIAPEGEIQMIMYKLKAIGVKSIVFSGGGEPTLHSRLTDILQFGYEIGFSQALKTNGVIFDPDCLKYLEYIEFSLDSPDAKTYKSIHGQNDFNKVEANIKKAVKVKQDLGINTNIGIHMIINPDNYNQIIWMLNVAEALNVSYFKFDLAEGINYPDEVKPIINLIKVEIESRDNRINVILPKEVKGINFTTCPGADFFGTVDSYGNFYICRHHVGDPKACYGNILNTDFMDELLQKRHIIQKNFEYSKCPIPCRGYELNTALVNLAHKEDDFV